MSQIITNRVRTSRRALLKGLTAAGARIVLAFRHWCRCSIRRGPLMRPRPTTAAKAPLVEKPIETVLFCGSTGTAFRNATGFPLKKEATTN
jgi:hypothetical protein